MKANFQLAIKTGSLIVNKKNIKMAGQVTAVTDTLKKKKTKKEYCLLQCGTSDFLTSIV